MQDLYENWQKALDYSKSQISEVGFETWLKFMHPIIIDDGYLIVAVPNFFTQNVLKNRYDSLIEDAFYKFTSQKIKIKYVIATDEEIETLKQSYTKNNTKKENNINNYLNPKYTFDSFVVGNGNRFAHAAALAVAKDPAHAYNPLFIYGGVGLGKTHLMHAIVHYINDDKKNLNSMYVTSEKFTNELINAIQNHDNESFRNKYRNVDILLIDDIQFIAGKESTQEEFFHTFNALYETNKQIIISSDRPPKEIPTLEDRLRSRFEWGLIADIQPPDLETRVAILKKKAESENIEVSNDVLLFIATHIKSNIRELEGALTKIFAYASLADGVINEQIAQEALKDLATPQKKNITISLIQNIVAESFNLKIDDLKSPKRSRNVAYPRQIAMYLSRALTDQSLPKIGDEFGGRDHTTIIHACEKIKNEIEKDSNLKDEINRLRKKIVDE